MPIEDVLLDLKHKIEKNLPAGVTITDVEFEGPQLVLYTEEPRKFADDGNIIRNLAKELRTRIAMESTRTPSISKINAFNTVMTPELKLSD